jgi:hypothetical protein
MRKQKRQQQSSNTTHPEKKVLGQLWGIDFFLIHERRILPRVVALHLDQSRLYVLNGL